MRIEVGNGTVELSGAAPAVGFTMEVDETGPDKVEVRFRSDDHDSRFKGDWNNGELRIDIDEG